MKASANRLVLSTYIDGKHQLPLHSYETGLYLHALTTAQLHKLQDRTSAALPNLDVTELYRLSRDIVSYQVISFKLLADNQPPKVDSAEGQQGHL